MHISLTCSVDRRQLDSEGSKFYGLTCHEKHIISAHPVEKHLADNLQRGRIHVGIYPTDEGVRLCKLFGDDPTELVQKDAISLKEGWIMTSYGSDTIAPNDLYVSIAIGDDSEGQFIDEVNTCLMSEHLYMQIDVDLEFSLVENNPYMKRSTTVSQFLNGERFYVSGLPTRSIVRRAIP